jgi:signal transduction histidine kinase
MVAVTALAVVVLSVPLAQVVASLDRDEAVQRLVDDAARAGTAVPGPPLSSTDPIELPATEDGTSLAVYRPDGSRLAGSGPSTADPVTRRALGGHLGSAAGGDEVVAAVPVGSQEQVIAAVRAALPRAALDRRVHRTWLMMGGFGLAAMAIALVVAVWEAQRLSRPLDALTAAAERLGSGDFSVHVAPSGVVEIDTVAASMNATADRLAVVLDRERAFSSDASHQLRTPLTALRLRLENEVLACGEAPRPALVSALEEIDRLQRTVEDLLRLARDAPGDRHPLSTSTLLAELEGGWRTRLGTEDRPLLLSVPAALPRVAVSTSAVRQILDVLVDNAIVHGAGAVRITAGALPGGLFVEVGDDGPGIAVDTRTVFARRQSAAGGRGIGLALARSLAEAEGGRLLLLRSAPGAVFRLVLARRGAGGSRDAES